jgi:glycine dehydrogenase subunit 1
MWMESTVKRHPYVPNAVPETRQAMLATLDVASVEELLTVIPERLRYRGSLDLPTPLPAEQELHQHVARLLAKNATCEEHLNFLGAGCWQHYVPAVCDEIASRMEFVTAYGSGTYTALGQWQAFYEFQSMMGELLEMEVVSLPTYDWASAAGFAVRMAVGLTGRREVLLPRTMSPERLTVIQTVCPPPELPGHIRLTRVDYAATGELDLEDLQRKISAKTAAVYFENPSYLGGIESQGDAIAAIAHEQGAECLVGVDPISLGVLQPPARYGADIVCGEVQSLGIPMQYGGGLGGFIASRDEARYVAEYPLNLVSITETARDGEFGFGYCTHERTLYMSREQGRDFTGTSVGLWTIVAAVYLALMGPDGIREVGEAILDRAHDAAERLSAIEGVDVLFQPHFFKEFVVSFDATGQTVPDVNAALLRRGIFGGKDLTATFPELGNAALYCVTEVHTPEDLARLAQAVEAVVQ